MAQRSSPVVLVAGIRLKMGQVCRRFIGWKHCEVKKSKPPQGDSFGANNAKKRKYISLSFTDTGLVTHLVGYSEKWMRYNPKDIGALIENVVFTELLKQLTWSRTKIKLFHFRSQRGIEIDFVFEERMQNCICVEVKSSMVVRMSDFISIQWFAKEVGSRFFRGVVLYSGDKILPFGKDLFAIPVNVMW